MTVALDTAGGSTAGAMRRLARLVADHGGALTALAVRVGAAGLGYAMQIALARLMGAADYGAFAYAWAWLAVLGFSATLGLGQTSVRWLAHYHERGKPALTAGFLRWSIAVVAGGSVLVAVATAALLWRVPHLVEAAFWLPMLMMAAIIPVFALGDLMEGCARAHGRSLLALAPAYLARPALLVAALPLMSLAGVRPTASLAMLAALAATLLTVVVQLVLVLRLVKADVPPGTVPEYRGATWAKAAAPVLASDMVQLLRQNADVLILAGFVPADRLALYFAATRVASLLGLVEFAVGAAAGHRFARAATTADDAGLARLVRTAAHLTFWPTLLGALALASLAPFVLALFGPAYAAGSTLVTVLAAGYVFRAAIGPAEELLIMRGHALAAFAAQAAGLVVLVALAALLVPVIGPMGAAMANAAALLMTTLALALACLRQTGVMPLPFPPAALKDDTP